MSAAIILKMLGTMLAAGLLLAGMVWIAWRLTASGKQGEK